MYRDIIIFKEDTPADILAELKKICISAHTNISGNVKIKEISDKQFVFEGTRDDYGCLQLGYLTLDDSILFKKHIASWQWEDERPCESCDLIEALSIVAK